MKTVLITGSTSGIGLGIARGFAKLGYRVIVNGLLPSPADALPIVDELSKMAEVAAVYDPANMSDPDDIARMMKKAIADFGAVDVLVNNAGIQHVDPVENFPVGKWNDIIAINLSSAFHTTRMAVPAMKKKGFGRIINIASAHALVASPFKSAYVAAKHGIAGFTKTIALEVATDNITVNAVCPGYVLTPLVEKQIPDTAKARGMTAEQVMRDVLLAAQPTKKFVTVSEITSLTCYLASAEASSITGAILPMDGGWTAA